MRITNNMMINNMMKYLNNNAQRLQSYQDQLATGKKIQKPSDDPVVAARALKLRTDVAEIEQYKRNINDAVSWLDVTESTLSKIGDVLQRARELAVQGATGTNSMDDMTKISSEVEQLRNQIVHQANTTYAGRYIFSGFKTDRKLMNDDGTFAIDVVNTEDIIYEIGIGDDININVPGGDLFNSGADAASGTIGSIIQDFDDYTAALNAGDHDAVSGIITRLDDFMNNLLRVRADVGARSNRLELSSNRLETDTVNFTKLMSENEDVDMAKAIIGMENEENVYRASLAAGAKIIMPSLIDFLR